MMDPISLERLMREEAEAISNKDFERARRLREQIAAGTLVSSSSSGPTLNFEIPPAGIAPGVLDSIDAAGPPKLSSHPTHTSAGRVETSELPTSKETTSEGPSGNPPVHAGPFSSSSAGIEDARQANTREQEVAFQDGPILFPGPKAAYYRDIVDRFRRELGSNVDLILPSEYIEACQVLGIPYGPQARNRSPESSETSPRGHSVRQSIDSLLETLSPSRTLAKAFAQASDVAQGLQDIGNHVSLTSHGLLLSYVVIGLTEDHFSDGDGIPRLLYQRLPTHVRKQVAQLLIDHLKESGKSALEFVAADLREIMLRAQRYAEDISRDKITASRHFLAALLTPQEKDFSLNNGLRLDRLELTASDLIAILVRNLELHTNTDSSEKWGRVITKIGASAEASANNPAVGHFIGGRTSYGRSSRKLGLRIEETARVISSIFRSAAAENDSAQKTTDFIFALYGEWGRGKSTLIEKVNEALRNTQGGAPYAIVEFSAWQYPSRPEVWVHLYEEIRRAAGSEGLLQRMRVAFRIGLLDAGWFPLLGGLAMLALTRLPLGELAKTLSTLVGVAGIILVSAFVLRVTKLSKLLTQRYFSAPDHGEKLGLQAVIGRDLQRLLNVWIRPERATELQRDVGGASNASSQEAEESGRTRRLLDSLVVRPAVFAWAELASTIRLLHRAWQWVGNTHTSEGTGARPQIGVGGEEELRVIDFRRDRLGFWMLHLAVFFALVSLGGAGWQFYSTREDQDARREAQTKENSATQVAQLRLVWPVQRKIAEAEMPFLKGQPQHLHTIDHPWIEPALYALLSVIAVGVVAGAIVLAREPNTCQRLMLVVDDLDRCDPKQMVAVIESLRVFLDVPSVRRRLQMTMLMDRRFLEIALWERAKECKYAPVLESQFRFLKMQREKLFMCELEMPPLDEADRNDFIKDIIREPENRNVSGANLNDTPPLVGVNINEDPRTSVAAGAVVQKPSLEGTPTEKQPEPTTAQPSATIFSAESKRQERTITVDERIILGAIEEDALARALEATCPGSLTPRSMLMAKVRFQLARQLLIEMGRYQELIANPGGFDALAQRIVGALAYTSSSEAPLLAPDLERIIAHVTCDWDSRYSAADSHIPATGV